MRMRLPKLNAFAKAQAWGLALSFAIALHFTNQLHYGLGVFVIGTAAAWLGWEMLLGKTAPSARTDLRAIAYGIGTGLAFPGLGFALAALVAWARP